MLIDIYLIHCVFFIIQGQLPPPVIKKVKVINDCNVNLTWSPPRNIRCPLTMYIIHYRKVVDNETDWRHIDVINATNTFHVVQLDCGTLYEIAMSVTNERGKSNKSNVWQVRVKSRMKGKYVFKYCSLFVFYLFLKRIREWEKYVRWALSPSVAFWALCMVQSAIRKKMAPRAVFSKVDISASNLQCLYGISDGK